MSRYRPNPPPLRDGLAASCVVVPSNETVPALAFFARRFPFVTAEDWQDRMRAGDVLDTAGQVVSPHTMLQPGQRLYYFRAVPQEPSIPFQAEILWQDDHLLVVDKPHFLPVIPSGKYVRETLLVRLRAQLKIDTLSPIHRIDRDTAGLVLFSVNPASRNAYQALFRERQVEKIYHGVARWDPTQPWPIERISHIGNSPHFMQQQELAGRPNAQTVIRPLQVKGDRALYEMRPLTGQRHQLRVHMAALGLPLEGDGIYPVLLPEGALDYDHPLQLLARAIAFTDPITGEARRFESRRRLWPDLANAEIAA